VILLAVRRGAPLETGATGAAAGAAAFVVGALASPAPVVALGRRLLR
jgi:hypothetical protein